MTAPVNRLAHSMKTAILGYVHRYPAATFANFDNDIPSFTGDHAMCHEIFSNIVYWPCISTAAIQALSELLKAGEIVMMPASVLSYIVDGRCPTLRVAKKLMAYKSPRWLPVYFSTKAQLDAHRRRFLGRFRQA